MKNGIKNQLFSLLHGVQSLIYLVRIILFRAYLFLLFAMRMGGAMVIGATVGGAFWALERMETNWLSVLPDYIFTPMQQLRDTVLSIDFFRGVYVSSLDYGYEVIAGMIAVGVFVALRVATKIIAPVVFSFPMPRRPLAPVLRWIPPEHKIVAVSASIAVPRRREVPWSGDWQEIIKRLPERLQAIMQMQSPPGDAQAPQRSMPTLAPVPSTTREEAEAALTVPMPSSGANSRPSAPPVPPRAGG